MRRAQFQHVFTFIMLIIIAGVVVLLGYRFISGILSDSCTVERTEFANDLKASLRTYAQYGTVKTVAFSAPCDAEAVCFVDARMFDANGDGVLGDGVQAFTHANKVMQDEVRNPSEQPQTAFLIDSEGSTSGLLSSEKVAVEPSDEPLCINATGGRFRVGFEGKGRTALVTDKSQ